MICLRGVFPACRSTRVTELHVRMPGNPTSVYPSGNLTKRDSQRNVGTGQSVKIHALPAHSARVQCKRCRYFNPRESCTLVVTKLTQASVKGTHDVCP